ncbi:sigma-70 family RNA polymerase sigma factor [Nocardioides bruguierae]|uniref:sigma-70 family RNA polymerase sigma factor n=1 Tax=Nocardioides bruguierae TaxID=2945102 RepID=UPI0020212658|nr:sigma-70 family RNA polymerase sigma factor [Nocardioides bruguierae]MCL8025263.1 sigma-70 family RNA polymerase sigma factor [Nocardioides bruguierae]
MSTAHKSPTAPAAVAAVVGDAARAPRPRASEAARRQVRTARLLLRARACSAERRAAYEAEVVALHLGLSQDLARRYRGRGIADEDLLQVAGLGLVKAVRGYDPTLGHDFVGYAVPTILGELRRSFRDTGWSVRPPRSLQELVVRVAPTESDLFQRLGRPPHEAELAAALGVGPEELREARAAATCFRSDSLDEPASAADAATPVSAFLGAVDPAFGHAEARLALAAAVRVLGPRERRIVQLRFFAGRTQAEIGAELGISQEQVSRLLGRILRRLRLELGLDAA